jgi:hypothetical protein
VEEMNSSMIYLICCKNFCKCHSKPPPSTTIKKKGKPIKITADFSTENSKARKAWDKVF